MPERWLVVSNCQTFGLTNCIQALARNVEADACDYHAFARAISVQPDQFAHYDLALILYAGIQHPAFRAECFRRHRMIPILEFGGYHPDCCYVYADGALINDSIIGPYQSLIVFAAYLEGLDAAAATQWFRSDVYERVGYFDQWLAQRDLIVNGCAELGFDVLPMFRGPGRGRAFMHTFDHPNIAALSELARAILRSEKQPMFDHVPPPPDALAETWWPVYPEIGEQVGVCGSYLFKPLKVHKPIELADYVERSLASFARWPAERLNCQPAVAARLEALRLMMREGR